MKKTLSIFLIMLVIIGMFASCNVNEEPTNTDTNSDNTSSDTGTDTSVNANLHEKYGNKVYFAIEEKDIYYSEIREYEKVSNCFDIPKDAEGLKK